MDRAAHRVATYRFRSTFGRRWGSYLALALLTDYGVSVLSVQGPGAALALGAVVALAVTVAGQASIAIGRGLLGNAVAVLPERVAARTSTALLLRAE